MKKWWHWLLFGALFVGAIAYVVWDRISRERRRRELLKQLDSLEESTEARLQRERHQSQERQAYIRARLRAQKLHLALQVKSLENAKTATEISNEWLDYWTKEKS